MDYRGYQVRPCYPSGMFHSLGRPRSRWLVCPGVVDAGAFCCPQVVIGFCRVWSWRLGSREEVRRRRTVGVGRGVGSTSQGPKEHGQDRDPDGEPAWKVDADRGAAAGAASQLVVSATLGLDAGVNPDGSISPLVSPASWTFSAGPWVVSVIAVRPDRLFGRGWRERRLR
jgi:hypothetical protein